MQLEMPLQALYMSTCFHTCRMPALYRRSYGSTTGTSVLDPVLPEEAAMFILSVLLAFLPVLVILVLLLWCRMAIDVAGAIGLALTVLLALFWFDTAPTVVARSALAGAVGSLPVSLVLAASIFQISVMAEMGAVARLAALMKTLVPGQQAVQILLINVGFGILLTGLGAATVAILPPILLALGYPVFAAILLPALGYVALCMYALLGVPAVVLATFAGQPVYETGLALASFMPVISTCVAFATLHVTGGLRLVREGFRPALLTGLSSGFTAVLLARLGLVTVTAILAGLAVVLALVLYVKATGRPLRDPALGTEADREAERRLSLARACSPWLMLTVFSLLLNTPSLPFFDLVFRQWSMPLEIIPGAPDRLRLFWQAYFWVIVCTLLCLPLLRANRRNMAAAWGKSLHRAWRPFLATVVYFAIAYVMNQSGKQADWTLGAPDNSMILVMAEAASDLFGGFYPAAAPFLGLLAGFVSGSASSAVAMFTRLHMAAAEAIHASGLLVATASSIGGGLAGVVSPSKLFNAAASIDRMDAATSALRPAFAVGLLITAVCAVMAQIWAY